MSSVHWVCGNFSYVYVFLLLCMRVAPKLTPHILLYWPTTSEADVGDMAAEVQPYCHYSIKFCCRVTDDSRGAVWQNGGWHGSAYEAKVRNWIPQCGKKLPPVTFIDTCWMFMETEQWMLARWGGGWCVPAVANATWKTSHVLDRTIVNAPWYVSNQLLHEL